MQLFNLQPIDTTVSIKYNYPYGSGNTATDMYEVTFPELPIVFGALVCDGRYSGGYFYIYFFTDRQLSSAEKTLAYRRYHTSSGYEISGTLNLTEMPYMVTHTSDCFRNLSSSGNYIRVPWFTSDECAQAIATATERPMYAYYASLSMASSRPELTDFAFTTSGAPFILPNSSNQSASSGASNYFIADGAYFGRTPETPLLTLPGYYDLSGAWDTWYGAGSGSRFDCYGYYLLWCLFRDANGDLDKDFDIDTPFNPFPADFYITVNCQTDGADKGEQSLTFSWTPQNIEELDVDLETVSLHFAFTMSPDYTYTNVVPYSSDTYATSYKSICEEMGVPWWRNIINKLPLPSQDINTTINVDIWWSTPGGNAGVCQYIIKYDGTNLIGTEKAKDPTTNLWTYLTANEGTDSQDYDPDPNPYDDLSDFGGGTDAVNGSALLTTSYGLSVYGAHSFGTWLWGTGLDLDQLKMVVNNPIENIVACKLFPFSVTGTASTVKLGNVTSPVSAYLLPENVARTFDAGDVTIPKKYNSFLDYAPYTNVRIYLPYLGLHEIETDVVMGATINVKYYVDLVTGHCRAIIFLKDGSSLKKIQQIDGMMGQDVPVVGSNRAQVEAGYIVGGAQAVASFAGGIGNAIMGNVGAGLADIGSAIKGGLQTAMQQYHTYTSGTPSPALSRFDEQKVCVFVDRPVYTKPSKFDHQNGKMCNLTCALNELSGYTVIDNTVDLTGIPCSKEERDQILKLLTSGVYL